MNFSIEESKENDLIIKAATGNIKARTIRNLLVSLTLQAVRINNQVRNLCCFYVAIFVADGNFFILDISTLPNR